VSQRYGSLGAIDIKKPITSLRSAASTIGARVTTLSFWIVFFCESARFKALNR